MQGVEMARFEIPTAVAKLVRRRFRGECAVCGSTESLDVAHIFEDATMRLATSDRLVLMCSSHNQSQERSHGRTSPARSPHLRPDGLLAGARSDYWEGRYWRGYGKARIAAYIYERQGNYSEAVECLTEAISALRPLRWGDWLAAVIFEGERLCNQYLIGIATRWLFLDRFALVLFDYARWAESTQVLEAAIKLRDRVTSYSRSYQQFKFDKQGAARREGLIKGLTGTVGSSKATNKLVQELEEQAEDSARRGRYDSTVTHLDVVRKLLLEAKGDREKAHEASEMVLSHRTKISHKWALLEHLVSEAEYFSFKKERGRMLQYASDAMQLYHEHPAILEPVFEMSAPIHTRIRRLGVNVDELLARGVPIAPEMKEVPLAISKVGVRQIVREVLNNKGKLES